MFYYIDQPCTQSFPIGLVKTESESLDQPILVVGGINVDTCSFLAFSDLTGYLEHIRIIVFWLLSIDGYSIKST